MTIGATLHGYYARSEAKSPIKQDYANNRFERLINDLYNKMDAPEARKSILASITTYNGHPAEAIDYRPLVFDLDMNNRPKLRRILELDSQKHALVVPTFENFKDGHIENNSTALMFLKKTFPVIIADTAISMFQKYPPQSHSAELIVHLRRMVLDDYHRIRLSFMNRRENFTTC